MPQVYLTAGAPYAWFHRPLPGYAPGFPIVLETVSGCGCCYALSALPVLLDSLGGGCRQKRVTGTLQPTQGPL
jgi:hypothetical protein